MCDIYWVGIRESEIKYTDFIKNSITLFGNNNISLQKRYKKIVNHNNIKNFDLINKFYNEEVEKVIKENPKVKLMYYSQIYSYDILKKNNLLDYTICFNNQDLIEFLSDKFKLKEYFKDIVPILDYKLMPGNKINLKNLIKEFNDNKFVIQSHIGSGGDGTILLTSKNQNEIMLNQNEKYMVTKYCQKNIPINANLLIADKDIMIMPPSIQIIENRSNTLAYKGCDYISYRKIISKKMHEKFQKYCRIIAKIIQKMGYRGICGIDAIIYNNEVYLMEINTRFQNSSIVLNKALLENNLPSLQELHYNCFNNKNIIIKNFEVNYSCYIKVASASNIYLDKEIEELDKTDDIEKEPFSYEGTYIYNQPIYEKITGY